MSALRRTRPRPPVRGLHLGLGSFFRAHQAWYTQRAADGRDWGIAAFTGRSPQLADLLAAQDGLYVLDTRGPDADTFEVVESLSAVHAGDDDEAWSRYWADPEVQYVTLTVTEAGYQPQASTAGRLLVGLQARRAAGAGPVTLVPCDNLPANATVLRGLVETLAERTDSGLRAWLDGGVRFVSTAVDRITPATTDADRARVHAATGLSDLAPVVTEPFSEWVLGGPFAAARPQWETAGARLVDDTTPYEARKLSLLNGAHSLLAYAGPLRGHSTVAEAISDATCRAWVDQWWDEACAHLGQPDEELTVYRDALLARFTNPAVEYRLAQIAQDGSLKLPVRVLPTVRAERAAGRVPLGGCRTLAAWVLSLRASGGPDPRSGELAALAAGPLPDAVPRVLAALDPVLADDAVLVGQVIALARDLREESSTAPRNGLPRSGENG